MRLAIAFLLICLTGCIASQSHMGIDPPLLPAPQSDIYVYRVGMVQPTIREDHVVLTIVYRGDTLAAMLRPSQMDEFIRTTDLPDTAEVELSMQVLRFDYDRWGMRRRLAYLVDQVDFDDLERRSQTYSTSTAKQSLRTP